MLVVPYVVDPPTAVDPDLGYVPPGLHVSDDLESGNELRTDLVPARLHHPLFELPVSARRCVALFRLHRRIAPCQPVDVAVVAHAEQHPPALKVREGDELFGKHTIANHRRG